MEPALVCSICICIGSPTNPVLTACGHLFCWPCLFRWLQAQPKPCPVCRTILLRSNVNITPIYASDESSMGESRTAQDNIPPRPSPPAQPASTELGSGRRDGIQTSASVVEAASGLIRLEVAIHQRLRAELVEALDEERERVVALQLDMMEMQLQLLEMRSEQDELVQAANDLVGRNVDLVRQADEREEIVKELVERNVVLVGEAEERNRKGETIAMLRRRVAGADRPVPSWPWSSGFRTWWR